MPNDRKPPQQTTVLVTGISGFLAGHIALLLLQAGYRVRGTVRSAKRATEVVNQLQAHGADPASVTTCEADLLHDQGWAQAVSGCDYVIHTASPFPDGLPKNEDDLIRPACEGTLRVLKAAHAAGVRRVVLTSSIAATNYGAPKPCYDENDWTDVNSRLATPYYTSKTLAEQAAWKFARETGIELAVINPSLMLGPLLGTTNGTSVEVVRKLLSGEYPALPRFGMSLVDVRDVADAHLRAMLAPQAAGERFITGGPFYWLKELADQMRRIAPEQTGRVPRYELPNWLVRIFACFDPTTRLITAELGLQKHVSHEKAERLLGWKMRPLDETIRDTIASLVARGLVKPVASTTR